jgi:hypothetical protein
MDQELLETFLARIRSHPLSSVFESIDFIAQDYGEGFSSLVTSPIDLGSVETKINSHSYHSLSDLLNDIELISKNAIIAFGQGTEYAAAADYLRQIAKKESKAFAFHSLRPWASEVVRLRNATGRLLCSQVPAIEPFPTAKDLRQFVSATEKLKSKEEIQDLTDIVGKFQPELVDNRKAAVVINLTALRKETLDALFEYVRRKQEHGRF